jgi:hypothetical protein
MSCMSPQECTHQSKRRREDRDWANCDFVLLVLSYCDQFTLESCHQVCKQYRSYVNKVVPRILDVVVAKYYVKPSVVDLFREQRLSNLILLKRLSTQFILIIRGFVTYKLELTTRQWTRCADTRRDRGYFSLVSLRGFAYAIGTLSLVALGTVERYNPFTDTWKKMESLPQQVISVVAVTLNDKIYVINGYDMVANGHSNRIVVHDGSVGNEDSEPFWKYVNTQTLYARSRHAAAAYRGKIWIVGGRLDNQACTRSVEIFDPDTNECIPGPSMKRNRVFGNLMVVEDRLYAVGGDVDEAGDQVTRTIERYDEERGQWQLVASFTDERRGFSTCPVGHKIFVFGGSFSQNDNYDSYRDTWDVFDTRTCSWESSQSSVYNRMPVIDDWGQAVTVPSSRITW